VLRQENFDLALQGKIVSRTFVLLLGIFAATTSLVAGTLPSNTDEARADAADRTAAADRAASLQPYAQIKSDVIRVVDTDSARRAAAQANAQRNHDTYFSDVLRVGAGIRSVPVRVTDTDSARAAAAQAGRERGLRTDHEIFVRTFEKRELEAVGVARPSATPADLATSVFER